MVNLNQSQKLNQLLPTASGQKRVKTATKRGVEGNSMNAGLNARQAGNAFSKASNVDAEAHKIMTRYHGMEGSFYTQ